MYFFRRFFVVVVIVCIDSIRPYDPSLRQKKNVKFLDFYWIFYSLLLLLLPV